MSSDDDDTRVSHLAGDAGGLLAAGERVVLDELRVLLASPAVWVEPPPSLEADTVAAIVHAAGARGSRRRDRGRRRGAWTVRALGVAGMVGAALVAAVIALGAGGRQVSVERFAMVVSGTALAPDLHGTARLTRTPSGWEIHLTVTGLRHIAGDRYYEGWLVDPVGERVAVDTFNDGRNVTLWAGVPPTRFTMLVVTVQRTHARLAESRLRVLVGLVGTRRRSRP